MYKKIQKIETADFEISHKESSHYCIQYNKVILPTRSHGRNIILKHLINPTLCLTVMFHNCNISYEILKKKKYQ